MYKVEHYIERCLKSCINQSPIILGEDYEIICINDGSPDESGSIAKRFSRENTGVIVYDQENRGLSAARNKGLELAQGEYVWFVDSDDWIEYNCLQGIFPYLKNSIDLIEIQYRNVYEDGQTSPGEAGNLFEGIKSGSEVTLCGGVHTPAQFTVFRSKFLKENNLEFVKGIYHEDVEFKIRALILAEKVSSIPDICYNYFQRTTGSITSNFKLKNGMDLLSILKSHYQFVQSYDKKVRKAIYCKISMWMNEILYRINELKGEDYGGLFIELSHSRCLFKAMMKSGNLKYMLEGMALYCNPSFGVWLYNKFK